MLDDLRRRFGEVSALDGLSMHVRPGTLHGFVGSNGAGKTTAMRIAVGIDDPDAGEVRWLGHRPTFDERRRRFGYMPEERGLYPDMRAREQLVYLARLRGVGASTADEAAGRWLERLGLGAREDSAVEELSLGNQQRVQLAAAMLHEPELLILDEPFSGLDPVATDVMAGVLREQADRGVAVLFSSHQLDLVERLCEHVTIIADGRVVADGGVEHLRAERAPRRLRVTVSGADDAAWAGDLAGVTVLDGGTTTLLDLTDDADDQAVLDAARRAGPVRRFEPVSPSLAELYREVTAS